MENSSKRSYGDWQAMERRRKHAVDPGTLQGCKQIHYTIRSLVLKGFSLQFEGRIEEQWVGIGRWNEAKKAIRRNTLLILLKNIPSVTTAYRMKYTPFSVVPKVLQHQEIEASGQGPSLWLQVQLLPHTSCTGVLVSLSINSISWAYHEDLNKIINVKCLF